MRVLKDIFPLNVLMLNDISIKINDQVKLILIIIYFAYTG